MTITKNARLLPALIRDTRITIQLDDPKSLVWGFNNLTLREGVEAATVQWGDGTSESVAEATQATHAYPAPGTYEVVISDACTAIQLAAVSKTSPFYAVYPLAIRSVKTNASALTKMLLNSLANAANMEVCDLKDAPIDSISTFAFLDCASLRRLEFPKVTSLSAKSFTGCSALTEIHFAKANEAIISALPGYGDAFGAENAKISFDL